MEKGKRSVAEIVLLLSFLMMLGIAARIVEALRLRIQRQILI